MQPSCLYRTGRRLDMSASSPSPATPRSAWRVLRCGRCRDRQSILLLGVGWIVIICSRLPWRRLRGLSRLGVVDQHEIGPHDLAARAGHAEALQRTRAQGSVTFPGVDSFGVLMFRSSRMFRPSQNSAHHWLIKVLKQSVSTRSIWRLVMWMPGIYLMWARCW